MRPLRSAVAMCAREPGRVLIVLGPPKSIGTANGKFGNGDPKGTVVSAPGAEVFGTIEAQVMRSTVRVGGRMQWTYDQHVAGLSGPIVFQENSSTHEFEFELHRGNVAGALAIAVQNAIESSGSEGGANQ